ncbi:2Fe-2S iron-sulfur cluster-binding protein [Enterobacterales bacterium AW_CKDN230030176-1A_HGKHYDSX7]
MPQLSVGERCWQVALGSNLLDALNDAGLAVPYGCRAGACQTCRVLCVHGQPFDARPDALDPAQRAHGWRLACQCAVVEDLRVVLDTDCAQGLTTQVIEVTWPTPRGARLRLLPQGPQHRPTGHDLSLTVGPHTVPALLTRVDEARWLEVYVEAQGVDEVLRALRGLAPGTEVHVSARRARTVHYDAQWQAQPLWLLGQGAGIGSLLGLAHEARTQGHEGEVWLVQVTDAGERSCLDEPLQHLAGAWSCLRSEALTREEVEARLAGMRGLDRRTVVLVCGDARHVEGCARRLFMAGLPRGQVLTEVLEAPR